MLFFACFLSYMLRVNFSINILAMTYPRDGNTTNTSVPDVSVHLEEITDYEFLYIYVLTFQYGPRYDWTPDQSNWLIGAYFWGYLVLSLPAGMLAEWFGGTAMNGWTLLVSGVITALSPMAAAAGFWPMFAVRFATGVLGVSYLNSSTIFSSNSFSKKTGCFISSLSQPHIQVGATR
jgi:MFS transporter, ACS family, solute carrier family 17 (sodium-dependent inorganic phosphate cotransporter), other